MKFDHLLKQAALFERLALEHLDRLRELELSPTPDPKQLRELERLRKEISKEEQAREALISKVERVVMDYIRGHRFQLGGQADQMIIPVSEFLRVFPRGTSFDKAADELEEMGMEVEDSQMGGRVIVHTDEWITPAAKVAFVAISGLRKFSIKE